jgi:hypothetical protein
MRRSYIVCVTQIRLAFLLLLSGPGLALVAQRSSVDIHQAPISTQAPQPADTISSLSCSSFKWISSPVSDKSGILVPITLDGRNFWYQLDTGAPGLLPYGSAIEEGWSKRGSAYRIPNVHFAGMTFTSVLGYPDKDMQVPPNPIEPHGTVGLELLIGKVLVIDMPRQRVCLLERGDLPESLGYAADWSDAEIRKGKLYMDLELNGRKLDDIFYDTGASSLSMRVDMNLWKEATGKSGISDAQARYKLCCSWGHEIELIDAPASGNLKIGSHVFQKPRMTTKPANPDQFRKENWGQGLLGNEPFARSIVILDLGVSPRFGIIESDISSK